MSFPGRIPFVLLSCWAVSAGPLDTWTPVALPADGAPALSVAYGNGKFVAVGQILADPSLGKAMVSTDGVTWRTTFTASQRAVGYFAFVKFVGDKFVLMGETGRVPTWYSSDGENWTMLPTVSANQHWFGFSDVVFREGKYNAVTSLLCGENCVNISLFESADFVTWTDLGVFGADRLAYGNGILAGGTWIDQTTFTRGHFFRLNPRDSARLTLDRSADGTNWERVLVMPPVVPFEYAYPKRVATGAGYYVVAGGRLGAVNRAEIYYTSRLELSTGENLGSWTRVQIPISNVDLVSAYVDYFFQGDVAFSGQNFVAVSFGKMFRSGNVVPVPETTRILRQPASATAIVGNNITLSLSAEGPDTLTYQWRRGAEDLPGETRPWLELRNVSSGMAGDYRAVVTSPAGSVTSEAARLTVAAPPLGTRLFTGVVVTGLPGQTYLVEAREEPDGDWQSFTNITLKATETIVIDMESLTKPNRVFRSTLQP